MGENYFNLKQKLEELGYNYTLTVDAVPLVECILADLMQTTRSLQHYMELSKEALMQRDSLMMEAEPYKCDNAKLIQENNQLHKEVMKLKEEIHRVSRESRRKIKALSEELENKDITISKLRHDLRDMSLRGLCAETLSSRNKSKRRDGDGVNIPKNCVCNDIKDVNYEKDLTELTKRINFLQEKNDAYSDEIVLLKNQIEHRENEIIRLNMLLEGGRPLSAISKDCCNINTSDKIQSLTKKLRELQIANDYLKKEIESGLEKQHEAMLRALSLADKNRNLQDELQKVDELALKVEEDGNKKLVALTNEIKFLQTRIEGLTMRNSELEKQIEKQKECTPGSNIKDSVTTMSKQNDTLLKEIKDLVDLNKCLQDKILAMSQASKTFDFTKEHEYSKQKCPTKFELQTLLEDERKKYETYIMSVQERMNETINELNKHLHKYKEKESLSSTLSPENAFVRDLHLKLCESEQKILRLKKENDELKMKTIGLEHNSKQNYKDVISQLNMENAQLSKENISLSQQLSQYKHLDLLKHDRGDYGKNDIDKLKDKIHELENDIHILKKDKHEYITRYKEALDLSEKLKKDLVFKQKEIEQLETENCSYKMTQRNGKASADHLREECDYLREQLKKMQTDVIKEKTLASQIKNIQIETERSSNELQNELLSCQKKLSLSQDTVGTWERKFKQLQSEISALQHEKSNLIDNIRKVDQERDKLVMELDNKTENICMLEQKIKSSSYEINKLESEISDLKRKLNINKVTEHKLIDYETQITFLNSEILKLNQQLENAIMENKRLQNSLADANGTIKLNRIEYEKSKKEVECLRAQLQHYVAEIRRIEELLSQKEAERSDMLEHFASLSVEANILENTNHSLENESASKSQQLQTYICKIQDLESKMMDKENIIETQNTRIATMTCKISQLENELKLISEEKSILQQNVSYLKQMCNNLQSEHSSTLREVGDSESEIKLYENRIKNITKAKSKLELDKEQLQEQLATTEKLLSHARREIVELKLVLQDATSETKSLQESVSRLSKRETEIHETTLTKEEFEHPIMLEEIHEVSHEEDEDGSHYQSIHKQFSKYSHSGTL